MSGLRFIDWFAGIGTARLGFERAGWECVWSCEWDDDARRVYGRRFGHEPEGGDITAVDPADIPDAECWVGGFPCVDISSAHSRSSRGGVDGARSGVWRILVDLAASRRPRWMVLENSPEWRRWMPAMRAELARVGYASVPLVLSAGSFGAPHRRPRGWLVANADGEGESLRALHAEVARLSPLAVPGWDTIPAGTLGMDDGVTDRMDRLRLIGNGMAVPMVAWLAARIAAGCGSRQVNGGGA